MTIQLIGLTQGLCTGNGPGKCSAEFCVILTINTFNINIFCINRQAALCSHQWGLVIVPSDCGPSWTCLLLHHWINQGSKSPPDHFDSLIIFILSYQAETDRDWPLTGANLCRGNNVHRITSFILSWITELLFLQCCELGSEDFFMRDNSGFSMLPKGWDLSCYLFPGETDRVSFTTKH